MRKYFLKIICVGSTAFLVLVLFESLFFFNGPIFQFSQYFYEESNIPTPLYFYIKLTFGFSIFAIYGFLNRDKYDTLFPDIWKNWLFFISVVCIVIFCITELTQLEFLKNLFREDHFFENMTFVLLFFSSLIFFRSFILIKSRISIFPNIYILLLALFCFGVAMEEISWGQRILDWQSPEGWNELNFQNETNIHNLTATSGIIRISRIGLTLSFSMMFGFSLFLRDYLIKYRLEFLIPDQKFFLFAFIVPLTHSYHELSEIIISLIFIFYSIALYTCAKKLKDIADNSVLPTL